MTEGQREWLGTSEYRLLDVLRARRAGSLSYVLSTSNLGGWNQPEENLKTVSLAGIAPVGCPTEER